MPAVKDKRKEKSVGDFAKSCMAARRGRTRQHQAAKQRPGRNEPRAALGNTMDPTERRLLREQNRGRQSRLDQCLPH